MLGFNYHTIDPLILETLNLNERRMNHILDILHGRPTNPKPEQPKVKPTKNYFENSLREDKKSSNASLLLPEIFRRNQTIETDRVNDRVKNKTNDRKYSTLDKGKVRKANSFQQKSQIMASSVKNSQDLNSELNGEMTDHTMRKNKSERRRVVDQSVTPISFLKFSKLQQVKESKQNSTSKRQPRNSLSAVRSKLTSNKVSKFQSPSMKQLSPPRHPQTQTILEQSLLPTPSLHSQQPEQQKKGYLNLRKKTKQMINDYMGEYTLRKSKSLQVLNPKDIYRLEIQNIIAELTPIEKLEEGEKKMKRIKRRHQHLKHFDQKYYSKLNQMDLITL